ncbi:LLM class flavin-dependent oxidoreductase, partial [Rhodococcoides fascians]
MSAIKKQIHLGAHFPGVNNTTVWQDPESKSQIEFDSFVHLAETAERGLFDFFFLAEGLRLREHRGRIHDLDVVGRPDTLIVLNALASVTTHLGLAGTINTTFNEPFELAKQFATLDHLSGGRAAWNMVTSSDAFTGENFRRGGYLDRADRYVRAREIIDTARELWDSWSPDALVVDRENGVFARREHIAQVRHTGPQFDIDAAFTVPRSPQGHPVLLQAGDSDEGREFGAAKADAIFTVHGTLEAG